MPKKTGVTLLITFLFIFFLANELNGQEPAEGVFPLKDSIIHYERIVAVDSVSKVELHTRQKFWSVSAFKSVKGALQTDDKEIGVSIYNFHFSVPIKQTLYGHTTETAWEYFGQLAVFIKDNKVKVVIDRVGLNVNEENYGQYIANYKRNMDRNLKKGAFKNESARSVYYGNVRANFIEANNFMNSLLDSLEKALRSKSGGFDF